MTVFTMFRLSFIKKIQYEMKGEFLQAWQNSPRVFLMIFSLKWASYCNVRFSVGIIVM